MSEPRTIHVEDEPVSDRDTPSDAPTTDAPYGRRKDGTPKAKPGPAKGTRPTAARKTTTRKPSKPDYREAVLSLFQLATAPLVVAGTTNETFLADAVAIAHHAPQVASALNDIAQDNPLLAGALAKVAQVGPYGALMMAVVPMAVQVAANHDALPAPVVTALGGTPKDEFMKQIRSDAEGLAKTMGAAA